MMHIEHFANQSWSRTESRCSKVPLPPLTQRTTSNDQPEGGWGSSEGDLNGVSSGVSESGGRSEHTNPPWQGW